MVGIFLKIFLFDLGVNFSDVFISKQLKSFELQSLNLPILEKIPIFINCIF